MGLFGNFADFLTGPVGNHMDNNPNDVRNTKRNLSNAGFFNDDTENGYITREMDTSIRNFQSDKGLRQDGRLFPAGETERSLFEVLTGQPATNVFAQIEAPNDKGKVGFGGNASGTLKMAPVPARKPSDLKRSSETSQHTSDPVFDFFRENLKPREGGIADRPLSEDRGGLTNQGITQTTLDNLNKRDPERKLPQKVTDLTDQQIDNILFEEFYLRTQVNRLNEIAGFDKTGSKLVEHVFDSGVMTNPARVGKWLQESIDETMGTNLKVNRNGTAKYDGILGSKTRAAMQRAVDENKTLEVSKKFWNKRYEYLQKDTTKESNPGWWPRVDSFKE